jgi:UPF0716 protein FxsA
MRILFFLLFVLLPIVEIALFILVGGEIGVLPTIGLVILGAVVGSMVVRRQGVNAVRRLQQALEAGKDPSSPIANGALIMVGGVLLMLPGFLTDAIGILLLIPPVRAMLIRRGASGVTVRAATYVRPGRSRQPPPQSPDVIEAEYEVMDDETPRRPGRSGWTRPDS